MRMQSLFFSIVALLVVAGTVSLSADRVKLRSGQAVEGSFMSADVKVVRVLLANGRIAEFPVDDVSAVEFSPRKAAAPPPPVTPDPAKAPAPITLPANTVLNVRLTQAIEVDAAQAGMSFKSLLDDPVMVNGKVVVPLGAAVELQAAKVEQAGKMKGADKITLKANTLSFGGRKYDIVTSYVEQKGKGEGKKTARKVGGGAGLGAIVGGIAGGGTGAAIGAAAGAATGAIMSSQGTEHLSLPAETRLQFSLSSAVTVQL
jgi:tRNA-binding EMAP/Myf-like protein